jgi:inhibitor of growth protein 3
MPRDDLSIDFVKRMPQAEPLDPGIILEDWINRVQNLPEEIQFVQSEVADKDRQYNECIRIIEDRDGKIQKWIKTNGSHEPNPKEELLRAQVRENYA